MTSPFKVVLCAVDFDDSCAAAMKTARDLLPSNGRLFVFHAANFPYALTAKEAEYPLSVKKERLEKLAYKNLGGKIPHQVVVESSDNTPKSILNAARRLSAGCIVIATHARKGLDRFLLGSIASAVVRQSSCPVVTVPPARVRSPVKSRGLSARK